MAVLEVKKINVEGYENYTCTYEKFDSIRDFLKTAGARESVLRGKDERRTYDNPSWRGGVKSYNEALEMLSSGYEAATEKMKKRLQKNLGGSDGKRITFKNDVVGYAPVVPLALQGVPQSMINSTMKRIKAKVIDVYYSMEMNLTVDSDKIIEIGSKVISAVIELEKQGYRVNLYAMQTYTDSDHANVFTIKLKDSKQPIDLRRISFPFMHTAFFRSIGFDWYTRVPDGKEMSGYGHAMFIEFHKQMPDVVREVTNNKNAVVISTKWIEEEGGHFDMQEVLKNESGNQGR